MKPFLTCFLLSPLLLFSEGKQPPSAENFRKAAEEYEARAQKFYEMSIYSKKLASFQRKAAELVDAGKMNEINWEEYHKIKAKMSSLHSHGQDKMQEKQEGWRDKMKEHREKREDRRDKWRDKHQENVQSQKEKKLRAKKKKKKKE